MRCLIVGAGSQGAAAAAILARDADVAGFTLADYDEELVAKVKAKLKADGAAANKIRPAQVDARDVDAVIKLARESDVILNFVHMDYRRASARRSGGWGSLRRHGVRLAVAARHRLRAPA